MYKNNNIGSFCYGYDYDFEALDYLKIKPP